MSGILGFTGNEPQTVDLGKLARSLRLLEHRELNDQAVFLFDGSEHSPLVLDPASQLLHCSSPPDLPNGLSFKTMMVACCGVRLEENRSVGRPSLRSADCRILLACDGLIDNGPELGRELGELGHNVRSSSPLDLILLAALEQWGPDCLSRVKGSFAFAAIDLHRRNLILARDAFGTRPLYYCRQDGQSLFFASQISAVLEISSAARRVNRVSLYRYLVHNIMDHGTETFFAEINQIPPGSYLEASLDEPLRISLTPYRRVAHTRTKLTFEEAAEHLRELVIRSVAAQVGVHNVVGAALSGGFDSSFVVAGFERAQVGQELKLYTCVPVVRSGTFSQSEEKWADLAAAGFRAPLSKVRVTAEGLPGSFAYLVRLQEEPFSSPVVYAQLQVFRSARKDGVSMMLSGHGGDTLFAASTEQMLRAVFDQVRRGHWAHAAAILQAVRQLPQGSVRRLARAAARIVTPESLQAAVRLCRRPTHPDWLKERWFHLDEAVHNGEFGLPMLRLEDRSSMACSLLNRMPLLTTELQDFVSSLPSEYLITRNQPMKSIESAAMQGMVPNAILARKERSGFPVPVREWLDELAPWVDINMAEIERLPFLEPRRVQRIWESVRSLNNSVSAAILVWRWVFLAGWVRYCNISLE
jgi:asparagine synthase (glutamine-hydrolysing)